MIDTRREDKLNIETSRKSIQYLVMLVHVIQESFCYSMQIIDRYESVHNIIKL